MMQRCGGEIVPFRDRSRRGDFSRANMVTSARAMPMAKNGGAGKDRGGRDTAGVSTKSGGRRRRAGRWWRSCSKARKERARGTQSRISISELRKPALRCFWRDRIGGLIQSPEFYGGENCRMKNMPERQFLRSVIQATDSTFTGCSAKSAAPSHAPLMERRRSSSQSNTEVQA